MKLSIRAKIIGGFLAIFAIGMIMGIYGLYSINKISSMSSEQSKIEDANTSVSDVLVAHYVWRQNLTVAIYNNTEFTGSYDSNSCALGKWKNGDESKQTANDKILSLLNQIDEPHHYIHTTAKEVMDKIASGDIETAHMEFEENILPKADYVISLLTEMSKEYVTMLEAKTDSIQAFQNSTFTVIIILIIAATMLSLILALLIIKSILKPLKVLASSANIVADGNFNVNFNYDVNDQIGELTNSFATLVNMFKILVRDLNEMASRHSAGDMDYFIESNKYMGEFKDVTSSVNSMINEYTENVTSILGIAQKYAEGDFSAKLNPLPGKKAIANTTLDSVSNNLNNVEESVMTLVQSALNGVLDKRIDDSEFKGGWKSIVAGMNQLLEAVDAPLVEAQNALSYVSQGKLDVKVTGKYKGQFEKMSVSINNTIEVLSIYISEISEVLNKLASDNFNVTISRNYVGSFSSIKVSLNAIIDRLNNVMDEIGMASEQVASGAGQISETSMSLSQGSSEQASSVEELNATIEEIHSKTLENADNSTNAKKLAAIAKENAEHGNTEMTKMLNSMTEINAASQNISKIIKVIEDIASQTNLLALNAAVESARAGEHGKGFAVVAGEVRTLASRSQSSVKETAALIEHSIMKVSEGRVIANDTAEALSKIVDGVENVSDIINKIETSSREQAASIAQVNEGIGQISHVTQENSATSQESAAAAEELSSQSEMLKNMISRFELKK